ncbi:MAG: hypothetical protein ABEJ80_03810 [Halarchaeum sp.]
MPETPLEHVTQLDHWTFLLAFARSAVETVRTRSVRSALVTGLLAVAFAYDAYEFAVGE